MASCGATNREEGQFGWPTKLERKPRLERGIVADIKRHAADRVRTRDIPAVAARDQPIQPDDHAAMGVPGQLQRDTSGCCQRGFARLVVEQHDWRTREGGIKIGIVMVHGLRRTPLFGVPSRLRQGVPAIDLRA